MEQNEPNGQAQEQPTGLLPMPAAVPSATADRSMAVLPQANTGNCVTCGSPLRSNPELGMAYPYIYAIGNIEARFPTVSIQKEFAQITGRSDTSGMTDQAVLHETLADTSNRYLARSMCYVMAINNVDTYILQPHDSADLSLLIDATRAGYDSEAIDAVIGVRGPIAPPEACNGLMLPIVIFDQIYSFDHSSLRDAIPRSKGMSDSAFDSTVDEVLARIRQLEDNAGATDEDRALNYLALRYNRIYEETANAHGRGESLSGIEVRRAPLSGGRIIVDVIFSYTNRSTDVVDKWGVRVDVTEEFPFLVTKFSPYLER